MKVESIGIIPKQRSMLSNIMYGFCIARSISDGVIDKPMDNINIPSADCISDRDMVDPIKDGFFIANPAASIVQRGDNAQNFFETSANDILPLY